MTDMNLLIKYLGQLHKNWMLFMILCRGVRIPAELPSLLTALLTCFRVQDLVGTKHLCLSSIWGSPRIASNFPYVNVKISFYCRRPNFNPINRTPPAQKWKSTASNEVHNFIPGKDEKHSCDRDIQWMAVLWWSYNVLGTMYVVVVFYLIWPFKKYDTYPINPISTIQRSKPHQWQWLIATISANMAN